MKKVLLSLCFCIISLSVFSQTANDTAFKNNIIKLNSAKTSSDFQVAKEIFAGMIKEDGDWRPSYYAALSVLKQAEVEMRAKKVDNLELLSNEASSFLQPILKFKGENSEITVLMAYVHIIKMGKNSSDFMSERKKARELLYLEVNSDPNNPRFNLLRAELEYLTLKNSNTSKNLKALFQNAAKSLKAFNPKSSIDPNWGLQDAQYYISLIK